MVIVHLEVAGDISSSMPTQVTNVRCDIAYLTWALR
jgi:hypothetical protein